LRLQRDTFLYPHYITFHRSKARNYNDSRLKALYKEYCDILNKVSARKLYFNKGIETSNNKTRATWKVIENATGNDRASTNITHLNISG
jgi:hypothetical protein